MLPKQESDHQPLLELEKNPSKEEMEVFLSTRILTCWLPIGIVVLEGSDGARCIRQMKDVAHCPLPILDTTLHLERYWPVDVLSGMRK